MRFTRTWCDPVALQLEPLHYEFPDIRWSPSQDERLGAVTGRENFDGSILALFSFSRPLLLQPVYLSWMICLDVDKLRPVAFGY